MAGCDCDIELGAAAGRQRRRVLWIVLAINLALFTGEYGAGVFADSTALQADSLDGLGDAFVYAISLWVAASTLRHRAGAALIKGAIQGAFGIAVLVQVVLRTWFGAAPVAGVMMVAAALALVANGTCFVLLSRFRGDDINMRSVWLCSRNDIVGNLGVIAAGLLVALLSSPWPDLVVGAVVAGLFLHTSIDVVKAAWPLWRGASSEVQSRAVTACCDDAGTRSKSDAGCCDETVSWRGGQHQS